MGKAGKLLVAACAVLVLVFAAGLAPVQGYYEGTGIGVQLGEPTGITLKMWQDQTHALQIAGAWSFIEPQALTAQVDYLIHSPMKNRASYSYYGIGGRIKFEEGKSRLGIRVPLGLDYPVEGAPLDIFIEFAPILNLAPKTEVVFAGALGFRYFFE